MDRLTFHAEILKHAPYTAPPPGVSPLDVTDRLILDGLGSVNRAIERDLLSFRTGDLTVRLANEDGFFDDLFAFFTTTDRWQFRLTRGTATLFQGVLLGIDGITFDRLDKEVELTAYGLAKVLDETDAGAVGRDIGEINLSSGVNPSDTTLTLTPSTNGLLAGDVLHLNDQQGSEDVTVKTVVSGTQVTLAAGTAGGYVANETELTIPKPFYRYKDVEFLVRAIFAAAAVPVVEFNIDSPLLARLVPARVNSNKLAEQGIWASPAERNARAYVTVEANGTYYTTTPDAEWQKEDSNFKPWIDWSRYYKETDAAPGTSIRFMSDLPEIGAGTGQLRPGICGFDFRSSPKRIYYILRSLGTADPDLHTDTTNDGTTWIGPGTAATLPDMATKDIGSQVLRHCEYDHVRDAVYATWQATDLTQFSRYYDVGSTTWSDLRQSDDVSAGKYYYAPVFCEDLDCVLMLRGTFPNISTEFEIAAFRGTQRLWVRPFPRFYVDDTTHTTQALLFPTESLRYVNGELVCLVQNDGKTQLVRSKDQFLTYEIGDVGEAEHTLLLGGRALGAYWMAASKKPSALTERAVLRAGPLRDALIDFADFDGQAAGQAQANLASMVNAVFWIDDEGGGHFVARDLIPAGDVLEIGDRILEDSGTAIWDEVRQYVEVSGSGATGTAGDKDFISEGFSLSAPFVPNEAFAQVVAAAMLAFIGARRASREVRVWDADGHVYRPMDRVTIDGIRWVVYESEHEIADEEWTLTLLQDLEAN